MSVGNARSNQVVGPTGPLGPTGSSGTTGPTGPGVTIGKVLAVENQVGVL